jgi:C-terminal processing protease CtpA/Prc
LFFLAGGVAAACGKIQVGDVVVAVGRTGVSGLKSAMLRDLIMGSPGTACDLVLSR